MMLAIKDNMNSKSEPLDIGDLSTAYRLYDKFIFIIAMSDMIGEEARSRLIATVESRGSNLTEPTHIEFQKAFLNLLRNP